MLTILSLGSNLGDRMQALSEARWRLMALIRDMHCAPIYETAPLYMTEQPAFLNSAIAGETDLPALELLQAIKIIEHDLGRQAPGVRYGPRPIDIDIVYYGDLVMQMPALTLPHPLRLERRFVLQPLADIAPDFIDPITGQDIKTLLAQLPPDGDISIHARDW